MPWVARTDAEKAAQREHQQTLALQFPCSFGDDSFVSPEALLGGLDELVLGDRSYITAGAVIRSGRVELGDDCSVNAHAVVAGNVTFGNGVRMSSLASVYGFNHMFDRTDVPIHQQGVVCKGVVIEDDVWIGSHAVVVDGVRVGRGSVLAAGAVVVKDVLPGSVVAGNPAIVIKTRGASAASPLDRSLKEFSGRVAGEWKSVLSAHSIVGEEGPAWVNEVGGPRTFRALTDAVEIADLFGALPPGVPRAELVRRLQVEQNPVTGLVPDPFNPPSVTSRPEALEDHLSRYLMMAAGYCLELLGSSLPNAVHVVEDLDAETLTALLQTQPWETNAWSAGDWIDAVGTGFAFNRRRSPASRRPDALFGWLLAHCDPATGLWGRPTRQERLLQPVNGFYRLTRGTFAQFGLPVPYPERTLDSVLAHSADPAFFGPARGNACNVLDVIHPLWLCRKQTAYRYEDGQRWALGQLKRLLQAWVPGRGFAFTFEPAATTSLQGTEMGLAIVYLLADYAASAGPLGYRPRGIHRPEALVNPGPTAG